MIKAIILDVDGVIIGEKRDFNFPQPHKDVIDRLKKIRKKGVSVSLCTAKPHYSIQKIIEDAELNNLHITNGGGVIIDPIDNVILKKHVIKNDVGIKVTQRYLENSVYVEFYSVKEYFIQEDQKSNLTQVHTDILQRKPLMVSSLTEEIKKHEVIKIMPIAKNEPDRIRLTDLFADFKNDLTLSWGIHPIALPYRFGIITAKGISKKQAVLEIAHNIGVDPEQMLGIGDSASDWQFIEQCGFAGVMGNASKELKELASTKGDKSFVGKPVDENGILDIFDYFSI